MFYRCKLIRPDAAGVKVYAFIGYIAADDPVMKFMHIEDTWFWFVLWFVFTFFHIVDFVWLLNEWYQLKPVPCEIP